MTTQCAAAASFVRNSTAALRVCAAEKRPQFMQRCRRQTDGLRERVVKAQADADACARTSEAEQTALRYRAAVLAAKAGDTDAQACIVQADYDQRWLALSDEDRDRYQTAAIAYFDRGLERGDWRVVQAMTLSRRSLGHLHGLQRLLSSGDEQTQYRMLRLLRWGAVGDYAAELDRRLEYFRNLEAQLVDFAVADAWAEQEYRAHFAQSPRLAETPTVCGDRL